ncbi:MFS transporter [Streptomyces sp. NBC_01244]|uniref:MFS transporter n=1 Tax=Streptomyces sp. NBC_01244 TaxID=2903797 RepID=UPI002E1305C7|nr:MFS transporter [Streptomyces sp. NBC_01244]
MSRARVPGPLAGRDFRLLYTSTVVSGLGDWLDQVALLVLVTTVWHGGAGDLALVVAASMLPLLATPFLAVLVDRRPSRRVLILTDLVQAGLTLGLVVAPGVYWAAGLVLVRSALGSVGGLAGQIQLRVSVPPEGVQAATVLLQTAMQSVKILGPALGGLLVALMSPRAVFAANACTFLVGVITARALRTTSSPSRSKDLHYFKELGEGFQHVFGSRLLRSLLFVMCSLMFVVFLYDSMAALIVPALGMGTSYIGYMVSAVGLGGVAGSLLMGRFAARLRPFLTMAGSVLVIGCIVTFIGFAIFHEIRIDSTIWLCVIFLLGIASAGILVTFPSVVHSETPVELTGRVWALMNSVPAVLNVLAPVLAAALVVWIGLGSLLLLAGAALLLTAAVVAVRLGRVPPTAQPPTAPKSGAPKSGADDGAGRAAEPTPRPAPLNSGAPHRETRAPSVKRAGSSTEEITMADKIDKLAEAGFSMTDANDAQQAVLKSLTEDEIDVLLSVKSRVEAAGSDVEGHSVSDPSGGYLW